MAEALNKLVGLFYDVANFYNGLSLNGKSRYSKMVAKNAGAMGG